MFLSDLILVCSVIASVVSFYFYSRERKGLREFIQQSRRHTYHKKLDNTFQKKAGRYLTLSVAFFLISMLLMVQKLISLSNNF